MPHRPLAGNVIPGPIGVQVGPAITLRTRVVVANVGGVSGLGGGGLIEILVPLVPGVRHNALGQCVAGLAGTNAKALAGAHVCLEAILAFHMGGAVEYREGRRRLIEVDADRGVLDRRNDVAARVEPVAILRRGAQLQVRETVQQTEIGGKDAGGIDRELIE